MFYAEYSASYLRKTGATVGYQKIAECQRKKIDESLPTSIS